MNWVIAISVGVAVLAFVVLVVFLCITLFSLRKTLNTSDALLEETKDVVDDLQVKIHAFDSLFRAVSNVGGVVEKKVTKAAEEVEEREDRRANLVTDALEFAILGVTLWQKIKERRS